MPITFQNRTISQYELEQGAAGSTDIVAAPGSNLRVYVVGIIFTLSAGGTIKFTEGTGPTDLTGALDIAAQGGIVSIGDGINPILHTPTANSKLSVVTTGGAAKGWIRYYIA